MSKFTEVNKKIEDAVVNGYQKIENTVVDGYKKERQYKSIILCIVVYFL